MRRVANAVVVAAVVAVVAVAAWDATGREGAPADPAAGLRELGARGEILYSDERCARRRLRLPQLAVAEVPRIAGCDVFAHRGSLGVVGGEVGWYAYPGGSTMLLTRRELAREADAEGARVVAAAWLANTRYAALVERPGARQRALLLFEGDRATRLVASLEPEYRELRSSPRAGWFAALGSGGRLALFDAAGAPRRRGRTGRTRSRGRATTPSRPSPTPTGSCSSAPPRAALRPSAWRSTRGIWPGGTETAGLRSCSWVSRRGGEA
ncbi:MAG TPA: hypothetical protein VM290_00210 [Gaiellaceae bacterium]|nr:hypothetical protein [Gaiellaceae bacterium]